MKQDALVLKKMAGPFADIRCLHSGEFRRFYLCLFDAWKSAPSERSLYSLGAYQFFWAEVVKTSRVRSPEQASRSRMKGRDL